MRKMNEQKQKETSGGGRWYIHQYLAMKSGQVVHGSHRDFYISSRPIIHKYPHAWGVYSVL